MHLAHVNVSRVNAALFHPLYCTMVQSLKITKKIEICGKTKVIALVELINTYV